MKERQPRRACLISLLDDCARTVQESQAFICIGVSFEKSIPQIVENIGKQNSGRRYWRVTLILCKQGVTGSIPVTSTNYLLILQ